MNKKVMAVAVAGALAAPLAVQAQTSTVNIYGNVYMEYMHVNPGGAGRTSFDKMHRTDSYVGFRGEEKLGGGMSAWFQVESTGPWDASGDAESDRLGCSPGNITLVAGNALGAPSGTVVAGNCVLSPVDSGAAPGVWADRNTAFGMKGAFGNIFFGLWDTPYKIAHGSKYRPFSTNGFLGVEMLHNGTAGLTDNTINRTSFSRRQKNSVNYHSPSFGGFQVMGAFSTKEDLDGDRDAITVDTGGTVIFFRGVANKSRLWSVAATYDQGPFYAAVGYEKHKDYNPAGLTPTGAAASAQVAGYCVLTSFNPVGTAGSTCTAATYGGGSDRAWELVGAYTFGAFKIGASYHNIKYEPTSTTELTAKTWTLGGSWNIVGPHTLRAAYTRLKSPQGTAVQNIGGFAAPIVGGVNPGNGGADVWGLAYAYAFSKRTEIGVGYASMDNDTRGRMRLGNVTTRNPGEDQKGYGITMRHTF